MPNVEPVRKWKTQSLGRAVAPLLLIFGTALVGLVLSGISKAATYVVQAEAESGVGAGNGSVVDMAGASGGKATKFGSAPAAGYTVNLRDFGAKCDGTANDQPALQAAADDIWENGGGTVIIPTGNCRLLHTDSKIYTYIEGPITFRGESTASQLSFDSDTPGAYREMFRIGKGNDVVFEGFKMVRVSEVYGMFIRMDGPISGMTLNNMTIDGRKDTYGESDIHGIGIFGQPGQRMTNSRMTNTTVTNVDFGLLQPSQIQSVTDGWTVDRCTFIANHDDDLEFNAPESTMTNITVTNSTFRNNKAEPGAYGSGFAIGYANVQHGLIKNNTFENYQYEAVHIEDRSADITVEGNRMKNMFLSDTGWSSYVFIINQSKDIRVLNNDFDTSGNQNRVWAVYAGRGGGAGDVENVTITGNTFRLRPQTYELGEFGTINLKIENNTIARLP